jgi:signal transduction histidine kinase
MPSRSSGRSTPDPRPADARPPDAGGGAGDAVANAAPPTMADQAVDIATTPTADRRPSTPISGAELWQVLDAVPEPLYMVDRQWRFVFVNRSAAESWKLDRAGLIGRSLWSVYPKAAGGYPHRRLTEAMRDRRPTLVEAFSPTLERWVEAAAYPVADGLVVYHRDVTRRHAAEEAQRALEAERQAREEAEQLADALTQAREGADAARRAAERAHAEAEAAGRAKSDFLATMSHELRTPINAITGYTQLLELGVAGPVTGEQRTYLSRLQASGQHLLVLVDDVLDFAKIEAGRMTVARDRAPADRVVAAALGIVAPQAAARSIRLVDEGSCADGVVYVGDEHRVRQILVNLLTNAVKFTPPGGTVAVRCEHVDRAPVPSPRGGGTTGGEPFAALRVADTGVGIAPENHARIFEPFVQVDGGRTRTAGGTGLGLAISRRLARLMCGDLTVESTPGHGATFTLWLPSVADDARRSREASPRDDASPPTLAAPALASVGTRLREHLEELLDAFVAHLRADPLLEPARPLSRAQLENHALTFVADVVQSLLAIDESRGVESELLRDGSAIQELIAFRHGEQRYRLGWTEDQLAREYDILATELEACARRRAPHEPHDVAPAVEILHRLVERARAASLRGHRHATRTSADAAG